MDADLQHAAENIVLKNIQNAMASIRERVTKAAETIRSLKESKAQLESRVVELEELVRRLEERPVATSERKSDGSQNTIELGDRLLYFSPDEREALERQINELLERVQAHLR
ncbi:MAG: hypothetical protein HY962_13605 [Ignavibacteriae bacterium]|nr:hypothetical protein [Ignavibacteriota bacterium]